MKKFLFTLLIGLYFLSILSCSTTSQIENETNDKPTTEKSSNNSVSNTGNDTTTPDDIISLFPISIPPKTQDDSDNKEDNSIDKPVKPKKPQCVGNIPEPPPISNNNINNQNNNKRIQMLQLVKDVAEDHDLEPSLICAIINQESGWRPKVISPAGAIGLMQIMPATGRSACNLRKVQLFQPSQNLKCGVSYFKKQLKKFGNKKHALCAYNAGPHRIVKYGKCPPFKETQHYHKVILKAYKRGNACDKAPFRFIHDSPLPSSPPDIYLSAKGKADVEFTKGSNLSPKDWWGLVCKNIDNVYYENIDGGTSCGSAKTEKQIKLWSKIFNVTVKDIYQDELRLKGKNAMPKSRIRYNIKQHCPKTTKPQPDQEPSLNPRSAKDMADKIFINNGYKNPRDWWKLVCKAIDEKYTQNTKNKKALTDSEKEIWRNILDTTVDEIRRDELKNKGYEAAMPKDDIKNNIISSCQ